MSLGTEHSFKYSTNLRGIRLRVRPCRKFIWVSKVIRNWSDYTSIFDWLRELTPLSKPIKCRTKTNRKLVIRVFGSLHASRAGFLLALCDNSRVPKWSFWSLSVCFCDIQSKTMTQGLQTVWNSETSISYFQYIWYFHDIPMVTVMMKFFWHLFCREIKSVENDGESWMDWAVW